MAEMESWRVPEKKSNKNRNVEEEEEEEYSIEIGLEERNGITKMNLLFGFNSYNIKLEV